MSTKFVIVSPVRTLATFVLVASLVVSALPNHTPASVRHLQPRNLSHIFDTYANLTTTENPAKGTGLDGCIRGSDMQMFNFYDQQNVKYTLWINQEGIPRWLDPATVHCTYYKQAAWSCGDCGRTKMASFEMTFPGMCAIRLWPNGVAGYLEAIVAKGWWQMTTPMTIVAIVCFTPDAIAEEIDPSDTTTALSNHTPATGAVAKLPSAPAALATAAPSAAAIKDIVMPAPAGCEYKEDYREVKFTMRDNDYTTYVPVDGKVYSLNNTKTELHCLGWMVKDQYDQGTCGGCWLKMEKVAFDGGECKITLAAHADGSDVHTFRVSPGSLPATFPYPGYPQSIACFDPRAGAAQGTGAEAGLVRVSDG